MTNKEYEVFKRLVFKLDNIASEREEVEIAKANSYREGYMQALADVLEQIKDSVTESEE